MAPAARAHRLGLVLLLLCLVPAGCGRDGAPNDVTIEWSLDPARPIVGRDAVAFLTARGPNGQPLTGARLRIEGHMSHPGMAPIVADLSERGGGRYETRLAFTMAGDWTLVMTGTLDDGRRVTRSMEVDGVRPAE